MESLGEYTIVAQFPHVVDSFSITFYGAQSKGNVYIKLYDNNAQLISTHTLTNVQNGPYGFTSPEYNIAGFAIHYNNDVGGLAIYEIRYGEAKPYGYALLDGDVTFWIQQDYDTLLGGSLGGNHFMAFGQEDAGTQTDHYKNQFKNSIGLIKWQNLNQGAIECQINWANHGGYFPQISNYFTWNNKDWLKVRVVWRNGIGVYVYANDVLVYKNERGWTFDEGRPWFGNYGVFSTQDSWSTFRDITVKEYGESVSYFINCRSGTTIEPYTQAGVAGIFTQTTNGLKIRGAYLAKHGSVKFTK